MNRIILVILIFLFFQSCSNSGEQIDNSTGKLKSENSTAEAPVFDTSGETAKIDSPAILTQPAIDKKGKSTIRFVIFTNSDGNGFGYDIEVEGRVYIHQPYIPAIQGNNGFASEADAEKVARLMEYKIKNNILPPTIEIDELDSLEIKRNLERKTPGKI